MKVWHLVAAALLAHATSAETSHAAFSSIVAFGDSLSDTGNLYAATGGQQPPAPYFLGRFSNGPVWVEYLATALGVPQPTPSATGGTNFAWGGAESGTGMSPLGTPNLLTQVDTFLGAVHTLSPTQLVTVWAGGNDFLNNPTTTNPQTPVNNIGTAITALAAAGGKTFIVPGLPLLGEIPGTASLSQAQRGGLDALTGAFNAALAAKVGQLQTSLGVSVKYLDINSIIVDVRANPGAFKFTNTTTGALNDGVTSGNGYLFWDNVHPTTAGHMLIAAGALNAVPEPSSFVLAAVAGVLVLGRRAVGSAARGPRG